MFGEPKAAVLVDRLLKEPVGQRKMSVASYLETGAVMAGRLSRNRSMAITDLDTYLANARIDLVPVDEAQARIALRARIEYGRGMGHGGALKYDDCFSYALAKSLNAPLLFIGDDFTRTDIVSAI